MQLFRFGTLYYSKAIHTFEKIVESKCHADQEGKDHLRQSLQKNLVTVEDQTMHILKVRCALFDNV